MLQSKLRHALSNSIIDISSIQNSANVLPNHSSTTLLSHTPMRNYNQNQNRARSQSRISSYLCHSHSDDSLDQEFIHNTKQTVDKLFLQTNFNQVLDQIQYTLQPVVEQLRQQIERKKYLSKQDQFICMKSCARFITESLQNEKWSLDDSFAEFYQLQQILNHFLYKHRTNTPVKASEQLNSGMIQLHIDDTVKKTSREIPNLPVASAQKLKTLPKVSFVSTDERSSLPFQSSDDLTRQKAYHRSVSHVFKKLNADLQKLNHETPFKAHLSKYHKHNH